MGFEKREGYVWSDEPPPAYRDWKAQTASLGVVAGLGATMFAGATRVRPGGTRALDDVLTMAKSAGNFTPMQMLNTFRFPEFMSPYASPTYQGMTAVGGGYETRFGKEFLGTDSTFSYLKRLTGKSVDELSQLGIRRGMAGDDVASELVFRRGAQGFTGELFSVVGGKEKRLASNVALQQFAGDTYDITGLVDRVGPVNRAAHATMQAMDAWDDTGFAPGDVFKGKIDIDGKLTSTRPGFIPVPGIKIPTGFDDLGRSTTLLRAFPAFSMERFNRLGQGLSDTILGRQGTDSLKRIMGMGPGVKPGPASHMFMRFGGKAAAVAGIGIGISQADWIRREGGLAGHIGVSAVMSGGVAALARRARFSGRTQFMAGLASFAGQMMLPGFQDGVMPGIANTWATGNVARANALNPVNYYRRTVEGFAPGITDWKTGAALGLGITSLSYLNFRGKSVPQRMLDQVGADFFKLRPVGGKNVQTPKSVRQLFMGQMLQDPDSRLDAGGLKGLKTKLRSAGGYRGGLPDFDTFGLEVTNLYRKSGWSSVDISSHMNKMWNQAEDIHQKAINNLPINQSLSHEIRAIAGSYTNRAGPTSLFDSITRQVKATGAMAKYGFFGADLTSKPVLAALADTGTRAPLGRAGLLFFGAVGAHQLVTGGLFGSMETADDLRAQFRGEKLVSVGKSRWWEMGSTQYEGSHTEYFRPHWYSLMKNRVRERGIWGEDEDRISPIGKFMRKNFTYELERRNYYDRPYPITSAAFADVPIIGGILSSTIGRLIKPPRIMHPGEWIKEGSGGLEFASQYRGYRNEPAYSLGAKGPGVPSSPFSTRNQLSFMNYQFRELEGLTGFVKNVLSDKIVGTSDYYTDQPQIADAGLMTSHRLRFWELGLGGLAGTNELLRRVLPSYRSEIERHNPIANSMPGWLPGKFHYGDPYRVSEWGEALLPGAGYSGLHPELRGVDPEDYPLEYQYDILANVAPYSKEFRQVRERMYKNRANGITSVAINDWIDQIDKRVATRFNIYEFGPEHERAINLPGSQITSRAYKAAVQTMLTATAPLEYAASPMMPKPISKFFGRYRDPIERYEFERLYGSPMAFWDKPIRDWLRPTVYSTANLFGFQGKPGWRQQADDTNAYFDQVEFAKWMKLASAAQEMGDTKDQRRYEYMAAQTRMGVNPQGNPLSIYWTLPAEERAFFNSFAMAQGNERDRIREMIPEDQVHLYESVWSRVDAGEDMFPEAINQPDRTHLYNQFYGMQTGPMPPEDWIGYRADVDVRDIQVRYIDELGKDLHDYGMWESELRKSQRQPFLDGSTYYLHNAGGIARTQARGRMYGLMGNPMNQGHLTVNTGSFSNSTSDIYYNDDREAQIRSKVAGYIDGY